jgi:methyl-accepting chemotaxis protein
MRLGIRKQIWSLPAIAVIVFGAGIAASATFASRALGLVDRAAAVDYPLVEQLKGLASDVQRLTDDFNAAVSEGEKKKLDEASTHAAEIRARIDRIGKLPGEAEFARRTREQLDAYYTPAMSVARIMLRVESGEPAPAIAAMQGAIHVLNDQLAAANERAAAGFAASLASTQADIRTLLAVIVVAGLLVIAALALVSWMIVRNIWRQLGGEPEYAKRIAEEIARGNLSVAIEAEGGEASQLAALARMRDSLEELIARIRHASLAVQSSAHEIAAGMTDLSSRTDEQASSLQQTASNMEELTAAVKGNADHAVRASDLARSSTDVAARGGEAMRGVVSTMDEIDASSREIASIVNVIDGIAFQTNILALNAAVEAARAGDEGRGFAVVAAEVRALAQRSAASARDIKALIEASAGKVSSGRRLVADAGGTMAKVVDSIAGVSGAVAEISTASTQQSAGITQMGRAVAQIENVTQQNAALVEQTSAAAQAMSEQARQLEAAVSLFRLTREANEKAADLSAAPALVIPAKAGTQSFGPGPLALPRRPG